MMSNCVLPHDNLGGKKGGSKRNLPTHTLAGAVGAQRLHSGPGALPPSRDCPRLSLPVSKLGTIVRAHPSPGVIKKLQQALAPSRDLKGKALPSGLAMALNVEFSKDFTKGRFPFPRVDSSLTSGTTPFKEQ